MDRKLTEKELQQRQKAAEKHGGAGAERRLTAGETFAGLAAEVETQVTNELENDGLAAIVRRDAIRLQTVADLYYSAILGADNLADLDKFVKRFGWLAGSTLRAWAQVRDIEKQTGEHDSAKVLEAIRKNGHTESD